MPKMKIKIDEEKVHEEVEKITKNIYFRYIQDETKKLRERKRKYRLGFASDKTGLIRQLNWIDVFVITCCSVIGLGISVRTVSIQTLVPGIGHLVPLAFLIGAVPAFLVALCYSFFSSSIPRSGGEYIFISRGFHSFLGFWASWTRWLGITIVMGLLTYVITLLFSDFLTFLGFPLLSSTASKILLALIILSICLVVNLSEIRVFKLVTRISFLIFILGGLMIIIIGFLFDHTYFLDAVNSELGVDLVTSLLNSGQGLAVVHTSMFRMILGATSILFFSYLALETGIAASGEIEKPRKAIPKGIVIAVIFITFYYLIFSTSFYHLVPWEFVAGYLTIDKEANVLTFYNFILPRYAVIFYSFTLVFALLSDIFPLMLSASRVLFAWSFDGLMPNRLTQLNKIKIPSLALFITYIVAIVSALECYVTGYTVIIDMTTLGMLWSYVLVALSVISTSFEKPLLFKNAEFKLGRFTIPIALSTFFATFILFGEFIVNSWNSFLFFIFSSSLGAGIYYYMHQKRVKEQIDMQATFTLIPPE